MAKKRQVDGDGGREVLSPKKAAREAIAFMKAGADEERAASFQRYFKEPVEVYGVEYAALKARGKEVADQVRGTWTLDDALLYCEEMLKDPHLEPRANAFQMVGNFSRKRRRSYWSMSTAGWSPSAGTGAWWTIWLPPSCPLFCASILNWWTWLWVGPPLRSSGSAEVPLSHS